MAAGKSQPLIEALRVDAGVVRKQLDQLAAIAARFSDCPLHEQLADAAAAYLPEGVRLTYGGHYQAVYVRGPRSAIVSSPPMR